MSIVREVLAELFAMFVADARLSLAILALVAATAGLVRFIALDPRLDGAFLLLGCLLLLVANVVYRSRKS